MIATLQIYEQSASMIEVPVEIRNRRAEGIFLVVDIATESPNENPDGLEMHPDNRWRHCRNRLRSQVKNIRARSQAPG